MKKILLLFCLCLFFCCNFVIAANYKKLCLLDSNYLKRKNFQTKIYEFNNIEPDNYMLNRKIRAKETFKINTLTINGKTDKLLDISREILEKMDFRGIELRDNILIANKNEDIKYKKVQKETGTTYTGKWVDKPFMKTKTKVGNIVFEDDYPSTSYEIEKETKYEYVNIEIKTNYKANILIKEISNNFFEVRAFFVEDYFEDNKLISMKLITKDTKKFSPYKDFFSKLEEYVTRED